MGHRKELSGRQNVGLPAVLNRLYAAAHEDRAAFDRDRDHYRNEAAKRKKWLAERIERERRWTEQQRLKGASLNKVENK